MDLSAFYIKYKQCHALADLAKSNEKRAVWERPCGKNRVLLHNHGRYRILYTIHYTGVCYYIIRGEQYFREEFLNVTENVAVNRYCSLCETAYYIIFSRWIIRITKQSLLFFFGFFNTLVVFILILIFIFISTRCVTKKSNQSFVTQKNRVNKNGDNGEQYRLGKVNSDEKTRSTKQKVMGSERKTTTIYNNKVPITSVFLKNSII